MCGGEMIFVDLLRNIAAEYNLFSSNPSNFSFQTLKPTKRNSESYLVM